jgi:hypothetical protein
MHRKPNGVIDDDAGSPQGIFLTRGQAKVAQYPLLSDLARLLADAAEDVDRMRESADPVEAWPVSYDTRQLFVWIEELVDALDALGSREFVERERAAHPAGQHPR